jgi:uncharacterized surface protein with fasciclin (FAS1) repeats
MKQLHYNRGNGMMVLLLWLLGMASACNKEITVPAERQPDVQPLQTILTSNYAFSLFNASLKRCGLDSLVAKKDANLTLLVPDNDAFKSAGYTEDSLLQKMSVAQLKELISYHILRGIYPAADIPRQIGNEYESLSGKLIYFSKPLIIKGINDQVPPSPKILHINGRTVGNADVRASNGIIQVLTAPLSVPAPTVKDWLEQRPQYSLYVAALKKMGLYAQLSGDGPFTLFVPENAKMERRGLTSVAIASDTFDTKHYSDYLFRAGILPNRIFITDFRDAPVVPQGAPSPVDVRVYSKEGFVLFGAVNPVPVACSWFEMFRGYFFRIGPQNLQYTFKDAIAGNGVIHGISDILVYPDSMHISHP